jgi:hypothetical protein
MYRQKVRRRVHAPDVILFLFKDQQFPRSVAFSLRELAAALSSLPRNGGPLIRLGELRRMLAVFEVTRLDVAALHEWIDDAQLALGELHGLVHATWFQPTTSAVGAAAAAAAVQRKPTQTPARSEDRAGPLHDAAHRAESSNDLRIRPAHPNGPAGRSAAAGSA